MIVENNWTIIYTDNLDSAHTHRGGFCLQFHWHPQFEDLIQKRRILHKGKRFLQLQLYLGYQDFGKSKVHWVENQIGGDKYLGVTSVGELRGGAPC